MIPRSAASRRRWLLQCAIAEVACQPNGRALVAVVHAPRVSPEARTLPIAEEAVRPLLQASGSRVSGGRPQATSGTSCPATSPPLIHFTRCSAASRVDHLDPAETRSCWAPSRARFLTGSLPSSLGGLRRRPRSARRAARAGEYQGKAAVLLTPAAPGVRWRGDPWLRCGATPDGRPAMRRNYGTS